MRLQPSRGEDPMGVAEGTLAEDNDGREPPMESLEASIEGSGLVLGDGGVMDGGVKKAVWAGARKRADGGHGWRRRRRQPSCRGRLCGVPLAVRPAATPWWRVGRAAG